MLTSVQKISANNLLLFFFLFSGYIPKIELFIKRNQVKQEKYQETTLLISTSAEV